MTLREAIKEKPSPYSFFCMGEPRKEKKPVIIKNIQQIEKEVCFYFGLDAESLHVKNRKREILQARQIISYLAYTFLNLNHREIASFFGQDRTTVINSVYQVQNLIDTEPEYKADVEYLLNLFNK